LPGGRLLHPYELSAQAHHDYSMWVREYQATQERRDLIVLRLVPMRQPSASELAAMQAGLQAAVGDAVECRIELVSDIALGPGGKFRPYRSMVHSEYGDVDAG
jgi:hypothetical protein